jgi:SAM-dependent methyltransferase
MLPGRGPEGFAVYAAGMEASAGDKAKLLAWVRPGDVADLGCGTGTVLELLRRAFPDSRLVGVDASTSMLRSCRERFPGLRFVRGDVSRRLFPDGSLDSIVLCSILHEVFSYKGYSYEPVRRTLRSAARALRPGGRLILRDGVKPSRNEVVRMRFRNAKTREKFLRFAGEFGSSPVSFREDGDAVVLPRRDAMEFLTKYLYEKNWRFEVKEHFGVFTLGEWEKETKAAGFRVLHAESYLLDWLRTTHWEKDVALADRAGKPAEWPHSTMIVVGERL